MKHVVRTVLCVGLLGLAGAAAQATPGSHLLKPPRIAPTGGGVGIGPGKTVTVKGCATSCVVDIKVTLVTPPGGPTTCDFNYAELALVLVPQSANSITWRVKAGGVITNVTTRFVQSGLPGMQGVVMSDNHNPVDPKQPVWVDVPPDPAKPDEVVKTINDAGQARQFKASAYTAFVEWKRPGDPGFTACSPQMDPIIMNDGM